MASFTFASILILTASMLAVCTANRGWQFGSDPYWPYRGRHHPPKHTQSPNKIVVGGTEGWRFNFSYTDWAVKHGPFYLNDSLVFKFAPPTDNTTIPHSVHLLPDLRSFLTCNLTGSQMLANVSEGGGQGFEFVLREWKPHFFACGQHDGVHCSLGKMKFFVVPMLRWC